MRIFYRFHSYIWKLVPVIRTSMWWNLLTYVKPQSGSGLRARFLKNGFFYFLFHWFVFMKSRKSHKEKQLQKDIFKKITDGITPNLDSINLFILKRAIILKYPIRLFSAWISTKKSISAAQTVFWMIIDVS